MLCIHSFPFQESKTQIDILHSLGSDDWPGLDTGNSTMNWNVKQTKNKHKLITEHTTKEYYSNQCLYKGTWDKTPWHHAINRYNYVHIKTQCTCVRVISLTWWQHQVLELNQWIYKGTWDKAWWRNPHIPIESLWPHRLPSLPCIYGTHGWGARGPNFEIRTRHPDFLIPSSVFRSFFCTFPLIKEHRAS